MKKDSQVTQNWNKKDLYSHHENTHILYKVEHILT